MIEALETLSDASEQKIDLDLYPLTRYVKDRICVTNKCSELCTKYDSCRFIHFTKECMYSGYYFQIANHNYVFADLMSYKPLLPQYKVIVFDEAHKLYDVAKQMYGCYLAESEFAELIKYIAECKADSLKELNDFIENNYPKLFDRILGEDEDKDAAAPNEHREANIDSYAINHMKSLADVLENIADSVFFCAEIKLFVRKRRIRSICESIRNKLQVFLEPDNLICWCECNKNSWSLCSIPKDLSKRIYTNLWDRDVKSILTSGTLSAKAVIRILKNEIYTGTLIQGKNTTVNYKVKKVVERDESEWAVIPNNHETIISKEQFDAVQKIIASDTRVKPGNKTPYLFSGFIECADCHSSLVRRCNKSNGKIYAYYMCSTNKLGFGCTSHRVNESVLHISVLTAVNTYCKNISDLSKKLNRISLDKVKTAQTERINDAEKKKKNEIEDLKHTVSVVKARCLENLETESACNEICSDIYNEIARLEDEILKLSAEQNYVLKEYEKNVAWIAAFTQMGELKELNRTVLARLIDRIYVYEDKRIVIRFNYQDKYEELLKFERKMNKEAV